MNNEVKTKGLRIYVGTHVSTARSLEAAQNDYDKGTEHICQEDGNPYHSMLDWKLSKGHVLCPECGEPSHITYGHFCPHKQATVVVPRPVSKGLQKDLDVVSEAIAYYCEFGLPKRTTRACDRVETAWARVETLAKAATPQPKTEPKGKAS